MRSLTPLARPTAILLVLMGLSPCIVPAQIEADAGGTERRVSGDYVLQPLDLVRMKVFQEPDLDREVRISRDSRVNLPLIGEVVLARQTVGQAEEQVRELYYRDFLVNPQISLIVMEYARRTVNVIGPVASPGQIEFPREEAMTLLSALTRAGGFTRMGDRKRVRLTRTAADGTVNTFIINVNDLIEGGAGERWALETFDIIFVPERMF